MEVWNARPDQQLGQMESKRGKDPHKHPEKHKVVRQTSLAAFAVLQSKETPDLFHHQDKKNELCFFRTTSMMQHTVHLKYNLSAIKLFLLLVSMLEHLSRFPFDTQGR
ncbi:hypothetical protein GOODEAATRI_008019 [Goodea atripinnis]|uniref:Uncharacterized protein n=1 Tax=Goodea atripinnis TaxID=208336 RepID=A0ABV0PCB8_9TELE